VRAAVLARVTPANQAPWTRARSQLGITRTVQLAQLNLYNLPFFKPDAVREAACSSRT